MKTHRKWIVGSAVLLLATTPSFALFGIGDIVFDPTSYANLVSQLTTLETQYTMLKNNIEHFSFKQQWQTALNTMKNANVRNLFGETNGMTTALNTNSPTASSTAWTAATVPVNGTTANYLAGQTPGSTQLSELAMIEASDSISPDCFTAVGQYRAARTQNATANSSLAAEQLDGGTATNSEVEQLNLLNAAEAQKMSLHFIPQAVVFITDPNMFSGEKSVGEDVETVTVGVRSTRRLQCRDSFTGVAGFAEVLSRRHLSAGIEDESGRCRTHKFLAGSAKLGAEIGLGQVQNRVQGDFERQQQFRVPRRVGEPAVSGVEQRLRFPEGGDPAASRIKRGKCPRRVVTTAILECADGREWIVPPAFLDNAIAVAGAGDERCSGEDSPEAVGGEHSFSLYGLPYGHRAHVHFQRRQIAVLDEFNRRTIVQIPVRCVQENAGMMSVAGIEVHQCYPDPVKPAQALLETAGVGTLANPGSLASGGAGNGGNRNSHLSRDARGVKTAGHRVEERGLDILDSKRGGHRAPPLCLMI